MKAKKNIASKLPGWSAEMKKNQHANFFEGRRVRTIVEAVIRAVKSEVGYDFQLDGPLFYAVLKAINSRAAVPKPIDCSPIGSGLATAGFWIGFFYFAATLLK